MKKASFWAAVALAGVLVLGSSSAFAASPCEGDAKPPCPPGQGGLAPGNSGGEGAQNAHNGTGGSPHGGFGVVSQKDSAADDEWVLLTKQGPVDITTDGDTKCKVPGTKGPASNEDCDQILNGHYVSVQWNGDGLARRVNLNRGRSLHEHCRGEIVSISASSLTVACRTDGDDGVFNRTFVIDPSTKFGPKGEGVDSWDDLVPPANQEVAVVASRASLSGPYTAKVVHKVAD